MPGSSGHQPRLGSQGFTLLELLIVLVLLGTVATLALPNLKGLRSRVVLEEAAFRLAADLQRARLDAIESRFPIELVFSEPAVGKYEIRKPPIAIQEPSDFSPTRPGDVSVGEAGAKVRLCTLPGAPRLEPSSVSVTFNPDGSTSGVMVGIRLADVRRALSVRLDPASGRVSVGVANPLSR
jgi:prepilin-type N-terminal cleavage/methylation domain-containing protein